MQQTLSSDDAALGTIYNNTAVSYNSMEEKNNALEFYQKAAAIRENISSPNDSTLASIYSSMAAIYSFMDKKKDAVVFYEKSLKIQESLSSPNHSQMYVIYFNTARTCEDLRNYDVAVKHAERSLFHARSAFGSSDDRVQNVQNYIDTLRRHQ
ncbi:unnamed protein product [Rotaria socialis]|nr:unnamed protein product [Rotaria socialis]